MKVGDIYYPEMLEAEYRSEHRVGMSVDNWCWCACINRITMAQTNPKQPLTRLDLTPKPSVSLLVRRLSKTTNITPTAVQPLTNITT